MECCSFFYQGVPPVVPAGGTTRGCLLLPFLTAAPGISVSRLRDGLPLSGCRSTLGFAAGGELAGSGVPVPSSGLCRHANLLGQRSSRSGRRRQGPTFDVA